MGEVHEKSQTFSHALIVYVFFLVVWRQWWPWRWRGNGYTRGRGGAVVPANRVGEVERVVLVAPLCGEVCEGVNDNMYDDAFCGGDACAERSYHLRQICPIVILKRAFSWSLIFILTNRNKYPTMTEFLMFIKILFAVFTPIHTNPQVINSKMPYLSI